MARIQGRVSFGQGSKGNEVSLVDGNRSTEKGSANAPFPGLDEVVSMKWRYPNRAGLVSMKWPPWHGLGSWGQERPPSRWVQGERSLPRVIDRRYDLMALDGFNALKEPWAGGCNGGTQWPPCQDGFVLQNTSCVTLRGGNCTTNKPLYYV